MAAFVVILRSWKADRYRRKPDVRQLSREDVTPIIYSESWAKMEKSISRLPYELC